MAPGGISEGGGVSACGRDSEIPQILPLKMAAGEKYDSLGGVLFNCTHLNLGAIKISQKP